MFITINCKNRVILYILIILIIGGIGFYIFKLPSIPSSTKNMEFKVVIDPGHGSIDTGTHHKNIYEKDINLSIAKFLQHEFKKINIIPIMTRTEDKLYQNDRNIDLKHRPEIAKKHKADLYISLHVNNFSSSYPRGSQIFYKPGSNESKEIAQNIHKKLIKLRQENNREILNGNFFVLNKAPCPAVLIESGFLSNPVDRKMLSDKEYQKDFACAIREGVVDYFQKQLNIERNNTTDNFKEVTCSYDNLKVYYLKNDNNLVLHKHEFIYPVGAFLTGNFHKLSNSEILAFTLLNQLISPPEEYISTLPSTTTIKSLDIKDTTLTINFSPKIKTDFTGGAGMELKAVKSLKQTLFSLPDIEKIVILIDGQKNQSIGGHIILNKFTKK